jgi:nucleotide-binding universal stress UspA family protein
METNAASGVVVGMDGSDSALRAVRWAAREAALRKMPLRIVHASPHYPEIGHGAAEREWPLARQIAHGLVGRARQVAERDQPDLDVETSVVTGPPARTLTEASRTAALLVVGARGLDGFAGLHLGSVAATVSAYARCPVVIVRRVVAPDTDRPAPVVVGVDGSPRSRLALDFAFAFAARRQLPLIAVHSWRESSPHSARQVLTEAANQRDLADEAERTLAEALAGWSERYPDVPVARELRRDRPVNALLSFSPQAELLVVGSRGHGGFAGMLLGSTSEALVRYASGPVAVVHPGIGLDEIESERGSARVGN